MPAKELLWVSTLLCSAERFRWGLWSALALEEVSAGSIHATPYGSMGSDFKVSATQRAAVDVRVLLVLCNAGGNKIVDN